MSSFIDRIRTCAYRSPSGATFTLQFDGVDRTGGKKVAIHELPQQNIADVQDLGNNAERFPMSVYFTGDDYDEQADAFWEALSEKVTRDKPGTLQHPRYGDIAVMPLTFAKSENLVDGLGRADFKIEFIEVPAKVVSPISIIASAESVEIYVNQAIQDASAGASEDFQPANASDLQATKSDVLKFIDDFKNTMSAISQLADGIASEINSAVMQIENEIDDLINTPLELFNAINELVLLPAKIITSVTDKIEAYKDMITDLAETIPTSISQSVATTQILFSVFGAGLISSTVGGRNGEQSENLGLRSRGQAIDAGDRLGEMIDLALETIEAIEEQNEGFVANESTIATLRAQSATAKDALLNRAFSLRAERRVILISDRTPLDLLAEYYGDRIDDLDVALDEAIEVNDLQGDEILLLPAGREWVYYA